MLNGHHRNQRWASLSHRQLAGRVVIVTGANSGIGKATAFLLSQHGAKVGLLDINAPTEVADEIRAKEGQVTAIQCDVRDRHQVDQAVQSVVAQYGPLHGECLEFATFPDE